MNGPSSEQSIGIRPTHSELLIRIHNQQPPVVRHYAQTFRPSEVCRLVEREYRAVFNLN
jgi:hypothetical protein